MTAAARLLAGVAALQFLLALPAWASLEGPAGAGPAAVVWIPLIALSFLAAGIFLIRTGQGDRRAVRLGVVFLAVVGSFSATPARAAAGLLPAPLPGAAGWIAAVRVEAFLPFALWSFAAGFPRATTAWDPWVRRGARVALVLGGLGLVLHLVAEAYPPAGAPFDALLRYGSGSRYWALLLTAAVPALVILPLRMRSAGAVERRRVRLLLAGVLVGGLPIAALSLLDALVGIPPTVAEVSAWGVYAALVSVPVSTAYAAVVDRALDLGLVLRRTLQYALARYTLLATGVVPLAAVAAVLFLNRDRPVGELFFGPRALSLVAVSTVAFLLLRVRRRLLTGIDRRFFREQYDARQILRATVRESREAASSSELERSLLGRVDAALHPRWSALLRVRPGDGWLVASRGRSEPLPGTGALVTHLVRRGTALTAAEARAVADRPGREWIERRNAELLVPLLGPGRELLGALALGPKRSELPYTREDMGLLSTAAEAVALRLDRLVHDEAGPAPDAGGGQAEECEACGGVQPPGGGERGCRICGGRLVPALIPVVVSDTFTVVRRLGEGGRGRAYLAEDRRLRRSVVLKVLEEGGAAAVLRLAREGRALATVHHRHVAAVHALEEAAGSSVLVLEHLARGTLEERLRRGPLSREELLLLVEHVVLGLDHLHRHGLLHLDLKPSNIGFSEEGDAKLLDFGQARVATPEHDGPAPLLRGGALAGGAGTVAYMSPGALEGGAPVPADDIWSLAVVVWEAASGENPFLRSTPEGTVARILGPGELVWNAPGDLGGERLGAVLLRALSPDVRRRPPSAGAFGDAVVAALD